MAIRAEIYKNAMYAGCGGLSNVHNFVTIMNIDGPHLDPVPDHPPVMLDFRNGALRIVPAVRNGLRWEVAEGRWQMGGAYVATPDSRFRQACARLLGAAFYGAVALHDRSE